MRALEGLDSDPPATVDVLQRIRPGCEAAFEAVLAELIHAAMACEGHLGVNVFRPSDPAHPEYRIVFKFDRISRLKQWEVSPIRQRLLNRARQYTEGPGQYGMLTGLETWFTLPSRPGLPAPPRYKMLVVSWITIFVLINLINVVLMPLISPLPPLLRTLVVTLIMVAAMTYVAMPRMTKLFSGWLYPARRHQGGSG